MSLDNSVIPFPFGLSLQRWEDPTGGGQENYLAVYRKPDGSVIHTGIHFTLHGSAGIHVVSTAAEGNAAPTFIVDPASGRVEIVVQS